VQGPCGRGPQGAEERLQAEAERRATAYAPEAEGQAAAGREVMRERRQTAVNIALGLAGRVVAGSVGTAGMTAALRGSG